MRGMRILIAGGNGFIGRRLAEACTERGAEVLATGRGDTEQVARGGVDAVVWAAGGRVQDVEAGLEVHARMPARVLESSGATRFVYLSSGEAYGLVDVPFRETQEMKGHSPYARAKIAGEHAVTEAARAVGAAAFLLRLGVVFGPRQKGQMLVPALLGALRERRRFAMTRGDQTRDVVYVDDVVRLILRALEPDATAGTYNVGTGQETRVIDVVTKVTEEAGRLLNADLMPLVEAGALPYRDGEQMRYCLDVSRAREQLGWQAEISLDEAVTRTVATFLSAAA